MNSLPNQLQRTQKSVHISKLSRLEGNSKTSKRNSGTSACQHRVVVHAKELEVISLACSRICLHRRLRAGLSGHQDVVARD